MFTSIFPIEALWAREKGKLTRLIAKNIARVFIHPPCWDGSKSSEKDFILALRPLRIPPSHKVDLDHLPLGVVLSLHHVSRKERDGRLSDVVFSLLGLQRHHLLIQFGYPYPFESAPLYFPK